MKPRIHPKTLPLKEVSGTSVLVEWNKSSISYVYESFVLIDRLRDQKKIFRIIPDQKKNTGINFIQTYISMVGWIYCLIHNVFRSGSGGDRNAPARHSEASNKKIFQTEIDFDVWSRLPLGAAIQKMQLGSKIFRRYQENDVYRIFNVNIIRIYTYIYAYIYIKFLINLYI
jgi:hypothetical protein